SGSASAIASSNEAETEATATAGDAEMDSSDTAETDNSAGEADESPAEPVITEPQMGTDGNDVLEGDRTDNEFSALEGSDTVSGGDGNDTLNGNAGNDTVDGGDGNDSLLGGQGDDVLLGMAGDDVLRGDKGADVLSGGDGADTFILAPENGPDLVVDFDASEGDRIGLGGGLTVEDVSLEAIVFEGLDATSVLDADGSVLAVVLGGVNADDLAAVSEETVAIPRDDIPSTGEAVSGSEVSDEILGTAGGESLSGFEGDDRIFGEAGDDILTGNAGNDTVDGGDGNDSLQGGQGNDILLGMAGDDILWGDKGADVLSGGDGADTFILAPENGPDLVVDFDATEGDRIGLGGGLTPEDITLETNDFNGDGIGDTYVLNTDASVLAVVLGTVNSQLPDLTHIDFFT
ncbi:calcium-binding protein, partial [Lyngbya sp. CCY1209]|uniref:calcium-binding protein n=1 Tax=Lyngbya sp. CCY1209 TaxID=2886103 RepID=UPI002D203046